MSQFHSQPGNASELLPCPFCGGDGAVEQIPMGIGSAMHRASCHSCGCNLILRDDAADSYDDWNTRAPSPAGAREALADKIEHLGFVGSDDLTEKEMRLVVAALHAPARCGVQTESARALLGAFYKTVDVMKSARNSKMMSVWADDMNAVEDVMLFLERLRDTPCPAGAREALDIRSLSQSTKDGRCLEVWFARNVTDADRANLMAAVNALRAPHQSSGMQTAQDVRNAALEEAAKIADRNGWEATAEQIRSLAAATGPAAALETLAQQYDKSDPDVAKRMRGMAASVVPAADSRSGE